MRGRLKRFLIWVSGADPKILAWVPEATASFTRLAGVVLSSSVVAGVSMVVALDLVGITMWVAIPTSLVWCMIVFSLNRWLVVSVQRPKRRVALLLLIMGRLVFALALGAVITTPLILWIFHRPIEAQLVLQGTALPGGLLDQLDALSDLAAQSGMVATAVYMLYLQFVLFEMMPVLSKVLGLYTPLRSYEQIAESEAAAKARLLAMEQKLESKRLALQQILEGRRELASNEQDYARQLLEMFEVLGPPVAGKAGGNVSASGQGDD